MVGTKGMRRGKWSLIKDVVYLRVPGGTRWTATAQHHMEINEILKRYLKTDVWGCTSTWRQSLWARYQLRRAKEPHHRDESNTITHVEVLGGLTESDEANIKRSVDKWKARSGWPEEELEGSRGEGRGRVGSYWLYCLCSRCEEEDDDGEGRGGQGSPRGQRLKLCAPLRTHQLVSNELPVGHAEYLTDTQNCLLLLTPLSKTHPPLQINTTMYPRADWNSKAGLEATGTDSDGQKGVAVVTHQGPIKTDAKSLNKS